MFKWRTLQAMFTTASKQRRPILLSFKFLGVALVGSLTMALVSAFAPLPAQIAILGALVSILAGLFVSYLAQNEERERRWAELLEKVQVPLALASDPELFGHYAAHSRALTDLARQSDAILREFALLKLTSLGEHVRSLARGTIVFSATEGWRTVYDQLLKSPDIRKYFSVAWVRTQDYWQDLPGRQSMLANFEAVHRGVLIERTIILPEELWSRDSLLPAEAIRPWIEEQHNHGLWVTLVRETDLQNESGLPADFGVYGDRAVGTQELDERCRTLRFVLSFEAQHVRLALECWQRLLLYAISYRRLLDQLPNGQ